MFEELKKIKSGKKELREFGITIGIVLILITLIALFFFKKPLNIKLLVIAGFFAGFGVFFPIVLKPLQKIWMGFSIIIGFFMSRVILSMLFFLVLTPIGLIMRLFGKDILDQKLDKNADTYWHDIKDGIRPSESYEKQY